MKNFTALLAIGLVQTVASCRRTTQASSLLLHRCCSSTLIMSASPSSGAFFATPLKAVVGASEDRNKFGNKVLRCYVEKKMGVVPVNKRSKAIEGIQCVESLVALKEQVDSAMRPGVNAMSDVGVSIITGPGVTRMLLEEGYNIGVRHFFLQPGTHDADVDAFISKSMPGASVVKGCVLVELDYSHSD